MISFRRKTKKKTSHQNPMASGSEAWREDFIARFTSIHGYAPNLRAPKTFSEKLLKRILEDEDPFYPLYGNKLHAPYFLQQREIPDLHFAERYKVRHRIAPNDFEDLPKAVVIKAAFASGLNAVLPDWRNDDLEAVCQEFNAKLSRVFNAKERTYRDNCLIFEEYLGDDTGRPPDDLKFHCFRKADGTFRFVLQIDSNRFVAHRQSFVDETYRVLPFCFSRFPAHDALPARPENFDTLISVARALSEGFDYIRVDLFNVENKIYFGELTPFHRKALAEITPRHWDATLGSYWDMRMPAYREPG